MTELQASQTESMKSLYQERIQDSTRELLTLQGTIYCGGMASEA